MSLIPIRQAEALRRVLDYDRLDLHTAAPGIFRSYDRDKQTADVLIGTRRVVPAPDDDSEDQTEEFPILPAVPVVWPFTSSYFLHLPITPGDGCLIVFCESDINAWRAGTGGSVDPALATRHALSGAVAIPGLSWRSRTFSPGTDPTGAEFGSVSGARLLVTASEVRAGGSNALAKSTETGNIFQGIAADILAIANFINGIAPGTVTNQTATALAANAIATTVTKGA